MCRLAWGATQHTAHCHKGTTRETLKDHPNPVWARSLRLFDHIPGLSWKKQQLMMNPVGTSFLRSSKNREGAWREGDWAVLGQRQPFMRPVMMDTQPPPQAVPSSRRCWPPGSAQALAANTASVWLHTTQPHIPQVQHNPIPLVGPQEPTLCLVPQLWTPCFLLHHAWPRNTQHQSWPHNTQFHSQTQGEDVWGMAEGTSCV